MYLAGTATTLTAVPEQNRAFSFWKLYGPDYPGDGSHATIDANNPITIVMNADRQVTAVFECGHGGGLMAPLVVGILLAGARITRRRGV